jgi:hypothetical protein
VGIFCSFDVSDPPELSAEGDLVSDRVSLMGQEASTAAAGLACGEVNLVPRLVGSSDGGAGAQNGDDTPGHIPCLRPHDEDVVRPEGVVALDQAKVRPGQVEQAVSEAATATWPRWQDSVGAGGQPLAPTREPFVASAVNRRRPLHD